MQNDGSKHCIVLVLRSKILKQGCGIIKQVLSQTLLHPESWRAVGVGFQCVPGGAVEAGM